MRGQIVKFDIPKRYGFIACGAKQIFFHQSNFARGFQPLIGHRVEFDLAPGLPGKPPMAVNVRYIDQTQLEQSYADRAQKLIQEMLALDARERAGGLK